jgi:hypothetical protein
MIADIQTQELIAVVPEQKVEYVFVHDADLSNVGGGICVHL